MLAGGQAVGIRHWTFGCAMTFGTSAIAWIATVAIAPVARNRRRGVVGIRSGRYVLGLALFLTLLDLRHRAALVGVRVADDPVGLAALVILGQVLGDREAFLVHEEQAVAVLVLLHLVAGADPATELGFFLGVG